MEWLVDHVQAGIPQRGKLSLTNQRLAFQPLKFGFLLNALSVIAATFFKRGKPWSTPLGEVARVEDQPPSKKLSETGKVIHLELKGGERHEFFFVTNYETAPEKLRAAIA
jgi:hypothetical protein